MTESSTPISMHPFTTERPYTGTLRYEDGMQLRITDLPPVKPLFEFLSDEETIKAKQQEVWASNAGHPGSSPGAILTQTGPGGLVSKDDRRRS